MGIECLSCRWIKNEDENTIFSNNSKVLIIDEPLNQKKKEIDQYFIKRQNSLNEKIKKFEEEKKKFLLMKNGNKNEIDEEMKRKYDELEDEKQNFEKYKERYFKEKLEEEKKPILIGLNNIGATCYMNSTLQCLSNTKPLTNYFQKSYKEDKKKIMANEYHKLILHLWDKKNNNKSYSPTSFKEVLSKENPLFAGIAANDSKDLVNFLLERFHQELNKKNSSVNQNNNINNLIDQTNEMNMLNTFIQEFQEKYDSPISNLFYGIMETESQCFGCKTAKYNFQIYSFLEFPLQQVNQFCYNNGVRPLFKNDGTNPDVDLYECFEYYRKTDVMSGENQMYCYICNSNEDELYGTQIYSAPNYLIINLNRGRGAVYECKVNFPEQLNLFNFITYKKENTVFELYAVICHLGPSSMNGHFVAYCKKKKDDRYRWYLFNDAIVSECKNQEEYRNGMPYILFYKAI
jgi:ubiquitin carboxyl-terminal hydrolase 2/21